MGERAVQRLPVAEVVAVQGEGRHLGQQRVRIGRKWALQGHAMPPSGSGQVAAGRRQVRGVPITGPITGPPPGNSGSAQGAVRPPRLINWATMTLRWISLVPSPTIISGASRK